MTRVAVILVETLIAVALFVIAAHATSTVGEILGYGSAVAMTVTVTLDTIRVLHDRRGTW